MWIPRCGSTPPPKGPPLPSPGECVTCPSDTQTYSVPGTVLQTTHLIPFQTHDTQRLSLSAELVSTSEQGM